jgi:acetyl esterase
VNPLPEHLTSASRFDRSGLDPQLAHLLDLMEKAKRPSLHQMDVMDAKIAYAKSASILDLTPAKMAVVEDFSIPARDGYAIPMRLISPREPSWATPMPLLVYYHGGGFTVGGIHSHDALCRRLAELADCMVLSVDYRLGPEWRFPTAALDAFDAMQWAFDHASELGADAARIALGGDSAGGTLAAVSVIEARNLNLSPVLQLLFYPGTCGWQNTPSHQALTEGFMLTREMLQWFFSHYLRSDADRDDWRFAPLDGGGQGADVTGCCPAWIAVAQFDPLVDEGIAYAHKLNSAGVATELVHYDGMIHDFIKMARFVPAATRAHDDAARALRGAFEKG